MLDVSYAVRLMAHDVFISYAVEDKATADAVCAKLEANKARCWIAPRDISPGVNWPAAIVEAIGQSKVMVLVYSRNANASEQVQREVQVAADHGVIIIPLRMEDVPLNDFMQFHMANRHWLDALTPPLEAHLQKLTETVARIVPPVDTAPAISEAPQTTPAERAPAVTPAQTSQATVQTQIPSGVSGTAINGGGPADVKPYGNAKTIAIISMIVALIFIPPVFGGIAIWQALRVKKFDDKTGTNLLWGAIACTVVGMVVGALLFL